MAMTRQLLPVVLLIAGAFAWPPALSAQQQEGKPEDEAAEAQAETIEEQTEEADALPVLNIVVAGTRTEKEQKDSPIQTEVITEDQIEASGSDTLEGVLGETGLQFAETGMGSHVQMQGMDGERILFLIDGRRVSGRVASNIVANTIAMDNVERIEIIRGPQSALYGSEAIGGVINIITKEPDYELSGDYQVTTRALLPISESSDPAYTSLANKQSGLAHLNLPIGAFANRLTLSAEHAFPYLDDEDQSLYPGATRADAGLDSDIVLSSGGTLAFGSAYSFHRQKENISSGGAFDRIDTQRLNSYIAYDVTTEKKGFLKANLYHNYFQRDKSQYSSILDEWNDSGSEYQHYLSGDLQYTQPLGDQNELTMIGSYGYDRLKKYNIGDYAVHQRHTFSLVLQDEQYKKDSYSLLAGLRSEYSNDYGIFFAPKLSGMYVPRPGIRILPSVGLGYRAPSFLELYLDSAGNIYHKYGNPDLDPERSVSFNLGVDWTRENVTLQFAGYHSELSDEIVYDYTDRADDDGRQVIIKENLDRSSRSGFDLSLNWNVLSDLSMTARYGYLFAYDRSAGEELDLVPSHTGGASVHYLLKPLALKAKFSTSVTGPHERSEHTLVTFDVYLEKSLKDNFELFGGVDNITGVQDDFSDLLAGPVLYLGIRGSF
ncbi:TonB-dependent receptor [Sediminispirochaeta smaragdinae DSM 11293]|uniref:TonB-dependent receptor n=2 Tax=Sediminispirochaeta TaxID=1911556 RepID=E1R8I7_SEDSS|nr:TonB-dependent receptor [Sediminispirochaeta smaragdinae DSM 11293]